MLKKKQFYGRDLVSCWSVYQTVTEVVAQEMARFLQNFKYTKLWHWGPSVPLLVPLTASSLQLDSQHPISAGWGVAGDVVWVLCQENPFSHCLAGLKGVHVLSKLVLIGSHQFKLSQPAHALFYRGMWVPQTLSDMSKTWSPTAFLMLMFEPCLIALKESSMGWLISP